MCPLRWYSSALVLLLAALSACFPKHTGGATGAGNELFVYIANDLIAPSQITVRLVADSGVKETLGVVPPASHQMLNVPSALMTGQARLEAQPRGAPQVVSPPFALANAAVVSWDLRQNVVQLVPRVP